MADHGLVKQVIDWLGDWDTRRADKPVIIDRDDAASTSFQGRRVSYDLTDSHVVSVASSPERQTTAIGTEYDHRVEDAVNVRFEGAHTDEHGTIADAQEWQVVVAEAKRVIMVERTSYPTVNGVDYHTVLLGDESNQSAGPQSTGFDLAFDYEMS
jgi:hypothetical protein